MRPSLSLFLEADEGAPRGRLSPFFLRHPFVRTSLSDNPHYESRYRDKAAGRLVTGVKPQFCAVLSVHGAHRMKNERFNEADHLELTAGCKGRITRPDGGTLNLKTISVPILRSLLQIQKILVISSLVERWLVTIWSDSFVILCIIYMRNCRKRLIDSDK